MRASTLQRSLPEWLLLVVFMVLSGYVWISAGEFSSQGQAWPRMLAAALFITTAIQAGLEIYSQLRHRYQSPVVSAKGHEALDDTENTEYDAAESPTSKWIIYFMVFLGFAIFAYLFGFLTVIPVFITVFMLVHGYRKRPGVVVVTALTVTLSVYVIFGYFANLPLTRGLLLEYNLDWLF